MIEGIAITATIAVIVVTVVIIFINFHIRLSYASNNGQVPDGFMGFIVGIPISASKPSGTAENIIEP